MQVTAIDCGLRWCGVATSVDDILIDARLIANPETKDRGILAWVSMAKTVLADREVRYSRGLVLEVMHHRQKNSRGDGADLLEVNGVVGALASAFRGDHLYGLYPHDWLLIKKEVMWKERVCPRLSAKERAAIKLPCASKAHNVKDAIGILLKHLGRLEPKRIIYR
jgi:hypothetical protein